MRFHTSYWATLAVTIFAATVRAQTTVSMGTGRGGSPHEKTTWKINGATVSIEYGRPFLKGRPESAMMPVGTPWRTGADQATVIATDKPLVFGELRLAAGSYTINTEPGEKEWHLILGKLGSLGQWGIPYQPTLELGRVPMKLQRAAMPVEQVTISIDPGATPTLRVQWGHASASVPFKVES